MMIIHLLMPKTVHQFTTLRFPGLSLQTRLPPPNHARILVRPTAMRPHVLQELVSEGAVRSYSYRRVLLCGGGRRRRQDTKVPTHHPR